MTQGEDELERALVFGGLPMGYLTEWEITADVDLVAGKLGVELVTVPHEELVTRYRALTEGQQREAAALAEQLIAGADQSARPRPGDQEIHKATRLYLAISALVEDHGAVAATIVCWPFIQDKALPVPCLALTLLQDRGVPAACQADIDAFLTMILFHRACGQVSFMGGGFQADGHVEISHCVLSRRMTGPAEPSQPYYLGDYHGRKSSPTIRTSIPPGRTVTIARLTRNLERLILTRGTVADSLDKPGRCRNTLVIDVPDAARLLSLVKGHQNHLVVACGDHVESMADLAERAGIKLALV
ncbi:MAG: hypothetical protein WBF17_23090 [Phycisphaerae bacterium]